MFSPLGAAQAQPQSGSHEASADYEHGIALAQLGRWSEARAAFLAARSLDPRDPRFAIELGGVAFRQKRYSEAARWLRLGLRLNPQDSYVNDFLGTIYFLQGNLEAALKYWNRIDKPQIDSLRIQPGLRTDPALLDRAFAFAPAGTLRLPDFLTTQARIEGLGIFPSYRLGLDAKEDGKFDASFDAPERNGFGSTKWEALVSTFRGAFYETLYPEYFNLGGMAENISSLVRWDKEKRRVEAYFSAPAWHNPSYRYRVGVDARNENWIDPQTLSGALNLRREAVSGEIASFSSGAWSWLAGAELSHRDYRSVVAAAYPSDVLLQGYQLKQFAKLSHELVRVPERRFESQASISSEAGAVWSTPRHSFEKLQASISAGWHPRMSGDDYAVRAQLRVGKTAGSPPFDELFMLGLERDNDLWMRAHVGTRDGRKGSAPLGRNYLLYNWEIDKIVYRNGLVRVSLSPFLDLGKITDPSPALGSRQWLWDTGLQAKLRVLGVEMKFIYGRDLRSGRNAFYVAP